MSSIKKTGILSLLVLVMAMGFVSNSYAEPQPHMRAALEHLKKARAQLKMASHDKGGHRVKALRAIQRAINQVKKGMRYDNRH